MDDEVRSRRRWLPELPEDWDSISLKYCMDCLDGDRVPLNSTERSERQGEIPYWGAGGVVDHIDEWIFDEPLILLGEDGAPFDDLHRPVAHYVNEKVWVNNHIHVLRARKNYDEKFLCYALNSVDYHPFLSGSTRDKLTQADMKEIPLPIPPIPVQRRIARFLDENTKEIDVLIDKKQRLLDLLDEKKEAIIVESVTGGLDEQTLLKDSGIPTIGKIPSHWRVVPNRAVFQEIDNKSETGEGELLTVSHKTGVTLRTEKDVNMFEADSLEGYKWANQGDLVINTMWAWMGAVGSAPQRGLVSPSYHVYRPNELMNPEYADYLYRTPPYVTQMERFSKGVWKSRSRLYPDEFLRMDTVLPPIDEQKEIVDKINTEVNDIDELHGKVEKSIDLLREKRQSMITKAVTGQINLSEWQSTDKQEVAQ
ncbi:restriction endonuclease subunit S [Haloarchaeobius sp. TZWWS8]|uniref:restriction endonuclease subunit S n=1 Tax=Haloarchaeobius sp. TZWWS8 TaxID=3446121 RepID=UPI003EBA436B